MIRLPDGYRWAEWPDDYDENGEPIRAEGVLFWEDYVDEYGRD